MLIKSYLINVDPLPETLLAPPAKNSKSWQLVLAYVVRWGTSKSFALHMSAVTLGYGYI